MCPRLSAAASKRGGGASYTVSLHVLAGRTLCTGGPGALNLRLNLLNCNGFSTGQPLQPVGHPLLSQRVPFLMTNAVQRVILALGTGATGDESR